MRLHFRMERQQQDFCPIIPFQKRIHLYLDMSRQCGMKKSCEKNFGLGIDLVIKNFAVLSNGMVFKTRNKTDKIIKLEKKLKIEQRCLSRKYEGLKKRISKERRSYSTEYPETAIKGTETLSEN